MQPVLLDEKFIILTAGRDENLLNKRSEIISKCRHKNKFKLKNFNTTKFELGLSLYAFFYELCIVCNAFDLFLPLLRLYFFALPFIPYPFIL